MEQLSLIIKTFNFEEEYVLEQDYFTKTVVVIPAEIFDIYFGDRFNLHNMLSDCTEAMMDLNDERTVCF